MRVIAFTGVPGSGKDECASILAKHGWKRIAFADPLRKGAYDMNPIIGARYSIKEGGIVLERLQDLVDRVGWTEAKKHPEVRNFLQKLGTEGGRDVHGDDCWVKLADKKAVGDDDICVTDPRFDDEFDWIGVKDGKVIWVRRPGYGKINEHRSEQADYEKRSHAVLDNDGTIEDLEVKLLALLEELLGEPKAQVRQDGVRRVRSKHG